MNALALVETTKHEQIGDGQQQSVNKFKHLEFAGPAGEDYLNSICQQILPTALWRTWRAAVAFQPAGKPCFVSPDKIAEATKPGVRKIYLDLQRLESYHLLRTTAFMYQKTLDDGTVIQRAVTAKNFEGLYDLAHEYHLWAGSPLGRALPPEPASVEFIKADSSLVKKLIRFDNYRRLLLCKKPGRKPKPHEEDTWYDGSFDGQTGDALSAAAVPGTDDPKVNLYFNTYSNGDSPKRISDDSTSNKLLNKDSSDSELPSERGGGGYYPTSACRQARAYSGGDYTKDEHTLHSDHDTPLPPPTTNPTNHPHHTPETSRRGLSARLENAEREPAVQLARQVMAMAQGRLPAGVKRRAAGDGKPRPQDNEMVSSFVHEFGSVLGDRNKKGSITGALRTTQAVGLEQNIDILMCLVRAYAIARDTREVRPQHRHQGGDNRMPVFSKMLKTFAEAWAAGNFNYTEEDLIADIAADERLRNWVIERGVQLETSAPEQPAVIQGEETTRESATVQEVSQEDQVEAAIIDTADLRGFWLYGGAQGLEEVGYRYVDLDGDLLTCQAYEQRRRRFLEYMLATEPLALSPETEYELQTYLAWASQFACPPEREAELLANLPPGIQSYTRQLEEVLDGEQYAVSVLVAPISHRRVIEVSVRSDPVQGWFLPYPKHVEDFIRWWKHTTQKRFAGPGNEFTNAS